jgi:predicted AlkP superfamily pyrophosphatase or phosphodiesterase
VVIWLPPDRRPSFITLYFSEVDHAGHDFGPDSPQLLEAVRHLDEALGQLVSGIQMLGLLDEVNLHVRPILRFRVKQLEYSGKLHF